MTSQVSLSLSPQNVAIGETEETCAENSVVAISNLHLSYAKGKPVLKGLSLQVSPGTIYGLLGPSGCGKTSLLKCVLGLQKAKCTGSVYVFGKSPCPGPMVGYSPQEIAMHMEMSVYENALYHARLTGVSPTDFTSRLHSLSTLLDLPSLSRPLQCMSGGQQRRASLLVALLHRPMLLILDEPTVGVDPLLRFRIWQYLEDLCRTDGVTVIITTHYIEEARRAQRVGLMRNGQILAQDNPERLLQIYGQETLEDVFLLLCAHHDHHQSGGGAVSESTPLLAELNEGHISDYGDDSGDEGAESSKSAQVKAPPAAATSTPEIIPHHSHEPSTGPDHAIIPRPTTPEIIPRRTHVIHAEFSRVLTRLRRDRGLLAFILLLPLFQISLFCLCIGNNPSSVAFGIVNHDVGMNFSDRYFNLGNNLTAALQNDSVIKLSQFNHSDEAINSVRESKTIGFIYVPVNYTRAIFEDLLHDMSGEADGWSVPLSLSLSPPPAQSLPSSDASGNLSLSLYMDETDWVSSSILSLSLSSSFSAALLGPNSDAINTIPIYGKSPPRFLDFIAPGMIVMIAFGNSMGLTAIGFVQMRRDGSLDRVWATGAKPLAVVFGHFLSATLLNILQIAGVLLLVVFGFGVSVSGPCVGCGVITVLVLMVLLGVVGMAIGLVISGTARKEEAALQASLGVFFSHMLASGILWPVSTIHPSVLRWISYALPTYWTAQEIRGVMAKGWGIAGGHGVWIAPAVCVGWTVLHLAVASRSLRKS